MLFNRSHLAARAVTGFLTLAAIGAGTAYAGASVAKNNHIDEQEAGTFAILDAGLEQEQVSGMQIRSQRDDGKSVYKVSFYAGHDKYEYEILAADGTVLEKEIKYTVNEIQTGESQNSAGTDQAAGVPARVEGSDLHEEEDPQVEVSDGVENPQTEVPAGAQDLQDEASDTTEDLQTHAPDGTQDHQKYITVDQARQIALDYAGLQEDQVRFTSAKFENDDDGEEFEIEFYAGRIEYEFDIDAITGKVLEFSKETDDD